MTGQAADSSWQDERDGRVEVDLPGYEDLKFGGRFADKNTVVGTLYGSGFSDFAITLARQ